MCCILCFDDSPVEDGPRYGYGKDWDTNMFEAPCKNCPMFCAGYFFPCCAQYHLRVLALNNDMRHYKCCQGYFDCPPCFIAGSFGEEASPEVCLCIESCCCLHCAIQSTRFFVMDSRSIRPDPCDNRVIRCHNCLQILSCVLDLAACISGNEDVQQLAHLIRVIADCAYYTVLGCMTAQMALELKNHPNAGNMSPPMPQAMVRPDYGGGQQQQMYVQQQPGYVQQQPAYVQQQPGYVVQQQPGYGQQPMGYAQQPQPGYGAPQPMAMAQPVQGYGQPPMGYGQPQPGYGQPPMAMAQPVGGMPMAQAQPVGGYQQYPQ